MAIPVVNAGPDQGIRPTYAPTDVGLYVDLHDGQGMRDWTRFLHEANEFTHAVVNEPALANFDLVDVE